MFPRRTLDYNVSSQIHSSLPITVRVSLTDPFVNIGIIQDSRVHIDLMSQCYYYELLTDEAPFDQPSSLTYVPNQLFDGSRSEDCTVSSLG